METAVFHGNYGKTNHKINVSRKHLLSKIKKKQYQSS